MFTYVGVLMFEQTRYDCETNSYIPVSPLQHVFPGLAKIEAGDHNGRQESRGNKPNVGVG